MAGKAWSVEELLALRQLWNTEKTVEEVAYELPGRSAIAVRVQAKRLHLHHTKEQFHAILSKKTAGERNGMYGKVSYCRGKPKSESTKEKLSKRAKEDYASGKRLRRCGALNPMFGRPSTMLGHKLSDEAKSILSAKASARWKSRTVEYQQAHMLKMRRGWAEWALTENVTWIEKLVGEWLVELQCTFKPQAEIGFYLADFLCNKIVVETHGDYWHGNPIVYSPLELDKTQRANIRRDKAKCTYLTNRGYTVFVLWEQDLAQRPEECRKLLAEILQ